MAPPAAAGSKALTRLWQEAGIGLCLAVTGSLVWHFTVSVPTDRSIKKFYLKESEEASK